MSTSDSIPPPTRDPALTFPLATLKATFLALCLVGTLFASPAAADSIPIGLTSGQTSRPVNTFMGAGLTLFGDQFSLMATLFQPGGFVLPGGPYVPGTTITIHAGWSGIDAPGSFTYQGQTVPFGGINGPSLLVDFLSNPFVVPPLDGSPIVTVPFTLTGGIFGLQPSLALQGTGDMTFTFTAPHTPSDSLWGGGNALFVVTPEPSVIVMVATALGGLGVCAWRRSRFRRSSATGA